MTVSHNLGLSASDIAVAGSNPARHSGTAEIFEGVNNFAQWVPARHSGLKEVETYPVFWFNRVCLHLKTFAEALDGCRAPTISGT